MVVNVSFGYQSEIGWMGESSYGEGIATTLAGAGGNDSLFFDSFGIVTDISLNNTAEKYNAYGIGNQTRIADPILNEKYELAVTCLWQDDSSRGTVHRFLETVEDATYDSFVIRILSEPDGDGNEYLYLIGCKLQNYTPKVGVGEVVTIDLNFKCKQIDGDDWQTLAGEDYDNVLTDATVAAGFGLHTDIVANMNDNEAIEFASTVGAGADSGKYLLIIGLDTDDSTWQTEVIGPLAADNTYVSGTELWSGADHDIVGVVILSSSTVTDTTTTSGTVTVRSAATQTTIATLTSGEASQGVIICDPDKAANGARAHDEVLYVVGDSACTDRICVVGTDASGAKVNGITMNGTTPVASADDFRLVYYIGIGDLATTDSFRLYGTERTDPTAYHECTVDFPAGLLSIDNEITNFSIDQNFNPYEIWNFTDSTLYLNEEGHKETKFSGSCYGDGTTMGASALLSKLISAAGTGNIVFKIGSYWEFNLTAGSYDSVSYPIKEKEQVVLDFEGTANSLSIDTQ